MAGKVPKWGAGGLLTAAAALASSIAHGAVGLPVDARSVLPEGPWKDYFAREARLIAEANAAETSTTLAAWRKSAPRLRKQLKYMLGLDPEPERGDLRAVVVGCVERDGVVAERIHFQPVPRYYVAANFYRPAETTGPLPAILYVCGHKDMEIGGVRHGNKTGYQHHGAWFAQNGFVCLIVDTLQLGEIPGTHHGTHAAMKGAAPRWWWNSRGYTPAGVEAWTGIRALARLS